MKTTVASPVDHRDEARAPASAQVKVGPSQSIFSASGAAMIEEVSPCGLRLRTEARIHPGEELTLKLDGEPFPLHARALWVRESAPFHRGGRKTWSAGCKLAPQSMGKAHVAMRAMKARKSFPWPWVLLVAGAIGALVLLRLFYLYLATL